MERLSQAISLPPSTRSHKRHFTRLFWLRYKISVRGRIILFIAVALFVNGCRSGSETKQVEAAGSKANLSFPGPQADGSVLLPNQWTLRPVGRQIPVGDFPVNIAVHPSGRFAAVLHCGYGAHEVVTLDLNEHRAVSRVTIDEGFYGLAFTPDGNRLFASGAGSEVLYGFDFHEGYLSGRQTIVLHNVRERGIPAGLAVSRDGRQLWAANVLGQTISLVDLVNGTRTADIALSDSTFWSPVTEPDPMEDIDNDAVTKRARALLELLNERAPFPYACVADEARGRLYVSLWGHASVQVIDLPTRQLVARWPTQEHPNEMVLSPSGQRLFVANANRNTVTVIDAEDGKTQETLLAELEAGAPPGSTPSSLALSSDETRLFVANANINAVAVFDVTKPGHSRSLGFIPTGWYPTSVRLTPDGRRLLVANGKGLTSKANRYGPRPGPDGTNTAPEYIGGLFQGTVAVIDLPAPDRFEERMRTYTERCLRGRPSQASPAAEGGRHGHGNPIPDRRKGSSPIQYCIYIIKENRTYDQILGDLEKGNRDPSLCLFPEEVTPNHHKLAREFVLLDNFYVEGEVSADGHEWTMGAYATDYVEKMWPMSYGHNERKKYAYPSEGRFKIAASDGGYLWDRAREAGVSYRSYGEFVNNGATTNEPCFTMVPALQGHFDPGFRSFDVDYSDLARADRFIAELKRFEREGDMPRLQIVRLPNDHTAGTSVGKLTPQAYVAENDLAFGRVVEAVSHSRFWPSTAIFVVEDDAQDGPDHVDAHRTIAYAISPYVRHGAVDSTLYSTTSMLRTIELILGLKPMSQFDAAAAPMVNTFQAQPDLRPYQSERARVSLVERNTRTAWGTDLSAKMDFSREDAIEDRVLNEVIWRSIKGPDAPMPAPARAAFIVGRHDDDD
jgi:DNA-binding beta-propeller fold protein YncE